MQEIGGYLQLDDFTSNEYYKNLVSLNTARNYFVYFPSLELDYPNIK